MGDVAYLLDEDKYLIREAGAWKLSCKLTERAFIAHLCQRQSFNPPTARKVISEHRVPGVYGIACIPNGSPIAEDDDGLPVINVWVRPKLQPAQAPYPTISRVLDWLTKGDRPGRAWLEDWCAFKVQHPGATPQVAVLFHNTQGSGKGLLFNALALMLGKQNTAVINREALESRFNARWITKLAVLGDELSSAEDLKDVSTKLKTLIGNREVEQEGKGTNQRAVVNRLAFMFASNEPLTPIYLDDGDRRYSVFANHERLPDGYREALQACYTTENEFTPAMVTEVAGWYADLLQRKGDASKPFDNEARRNLMVSSEKSYVGFIRLVEMAGWEWLAERYFDRLEVRDKWDYKELGVSLEAVHAVYCEWCSRQGLKPFGLPKLRQVLPWPKAMVGPVEVVSFHKSHKSPITE